MQNRLLATILLTIANLGTTWSQQTETDTLSTRQLQEVIVTARMPAVELEPGRTVYHPEASVTQHAGTLYDLLASLPGVTLDADGRVLLYGQTGIRLLIDGKETYLAGEELVALLRATPATNTDKIEITTQPSARHDAAGCGGMIDIRTKKLRQRGMNLDLNGQYIAGRSGGGQGGFFLNGRSERVNAFLNYSYYQGRSRGDISIDRAYRREGNRMAQESVRRRQNRAHHFRTGLDFTPVQQTAWSFYFGGNISDQQERAGMEAALLQGGHLSATRSRTERDWNRLSAGISLLHRLRREGGELSASVDAFRYRRSEEQRLHTDAPDTLQGDMPGRTNLCIAQADLTLPLVKYWKLTTGGKASYARIDNRATYLRPSPTGWQEDGTRGIHYIYQENIHAAYLEAGYEHRGWRLTAGLRMEHTCQWGRFSGNTVQSDSSFGHRNLHLFPNLMLQYGRPSGGGWQLSYTRRITRPNYGDLNPFVYIFDDYTYESGNTRLHPAFAHRLELAYVHRGWLQVVLWGSHEADIILKCYSVREEQRAYIMFENQPLHTQAGMRLHVAELRPLRRWTLNATALLLYNRFRYRDLAKTLTNRCLTPLLTLGSRFDLPAGWSAEVNVGYTGRMAYGQATLLPQGRIDLGVRRKFCGGRGTLSFFARDLLATDYQRIRLRISGTEARFRDVQYRRQVGIGLTWRIHRGEAVKENVRERVPEEVKRVNP